MNFFSRGFILKTATAIGVAIAILGNAGDAFSSSNSVVQWLQGKFSFLPKDTTATVILIFGVIILIAIFAQVVKMAMQASSKTFTPVEEKRARTAYLNLMDKDISNRIESSIHHARYVDLKLKGSSKQVDPVHFTFKAMNGQDEKVIESINPLIQKKDFSLLLLGAPGAGKTTTVLNCVNHFIAVSQKDENAPLPVLINLSKWKKSESLVSFFRRQTDNDNQEALATMDLDEWVIKTTAGLKKSGLKRAIVKSWLETDQVILFLDGLDEAEESIRNLIVNKINAFLIRYPTTAIMVCSRLADYEALVNTSDVRLKLDAAVTINPMTPQQITDYLKAAQVPELQELLDSDDELKEMARSPLDLSIMALACRYTDLKTVIEQKTHSITRKRVALFDAYVKAMIQRERRKRMPDLHWHDADFTEIPVPEKKINSLYKYLEWIAMLQSQKSMSAFSPHKLYEYYSEEEMEDEARLINPKSHVQLVNSSLLLGCLCLLSLLFLQRYPPAILVALPVVILAGYCVFSYIRQAEGEPQKKRLPVIYITGWPFIMIVVAIVYLPFGALFDLSKISLWITLLLFALGYTALVYKISLTSWALKGVRWAVRRAAWWMHLLTALIIVVPIFAVLFYNPVIDHQWIFIYLLAAIINAAFLIHGNLRLTWRRLIGMNVYALTAAVGGLLVFKEMGLVVLVILMVAMAVGLQIFSIEDFNYPALGIFVGAFAGGLAAFFWHPLIALAAAGVLATGLWFFCERYGSQFYVRGLNLIGSQVLLLRYKFNRRLPWQFGSFLQYCTRALLLKRSMSEFEFIHRRIRDYFAIRQYLPQLENTSVDDKAQVIVQISKLKDASCDVLLEMIDDHDKSIRLACLDGLGEIGSAIAAKSLVEAIRKTSGELNDSAIRQLSKIKDVAATPVLLQVMDEHAIDSPVFNAALEALHEKLKRLPSWINEKKMNEYIARNIDNEFASAMQYILNRRKEIIKPKTKVDMFLESLDKNKALQTARMQTWMSRISVLSDMELMECMLKNAMYSDVAFRVLAQRDPEKAKRCLLANKGLIESIFFHEKYKGAALNVMQEVFREIITTYDKSNLPLVLKLMGDFPDKTMEPVLLEAMPGWDTTEKEAGLTVLEKIASRKAIPLLLSFLESPDLANKAQGILGRFKKTILATLIKDESNAGVCSRLIPLLVKKKGTKPVALLLAQLQQENTAVKNAAIDALGNLRIGQARKPLLQLFQEGNPAYLDTLIGALTSLGESTIIPQLPGLFWQQPALRQTILSSLIRMKATHEIKELYNGFLQTGFDQSAQTRSLRYHFATYFALTGHYEAVVQLMYDGIPHESELSYGSGFSYQRTKLQLPLSINDVPTLVDRLIDHEQRVEHSMREQTKFNRQEFLETGFMSYKYRASVFEALGIEKEESKMLEVIYLFDIGLAREIIHTCLVSKDRSLSLLVAGKIKTTEIRDQKILLLGVIGAFQLADISHTLLPYLGRDDELTIVALSALGHLKMPEHLDKVITHLRSPNTQVVDAALEAIAYISKLPDITVGNLLPLILEIDYIPQTLVRRPYSEILKLLDFEDLIQLSYHEQGNFRYLATIYISILGHGKALDRLKELLEDNVLITTPSEHGHKTVSEGALYALNKIGTPSAKALVDDWQKR